MNLDRRRAKGFNVLTAGRRRLEVRGHRNFPEFFVFSPINDTSYTDFPSQAPSRSSSTFAGLQFPKPMAGVRVSHLA